MRKKIGLIALVALFGVAMQGLVSPAMAGAKVDICHVNSANDVLPIGTPMTDFIAFGRVISVNGNAVAAHLVNHGDSLASASFPLDTVLRDLFETFFGLTLPNADCFFGVSP